MTVYGPMITRSDVAAAARGILRDWTPQYIAEVGEQHGRARCDLPNFRSFTLVSRVDKDPEDQVPACIVACGGLAADPMRRSTGWEAPWSLAVGAVVSGRDRETTEELAGLYAAAIRGAILQRPSLGGFAEATDWTDESYQELGHDDTRTLQIAIVRFVVTVIDVIDPSAGPRVLPDNPCDPPVPYGIVEETHLSTNEKSS